MTQAERELLLMLGEFKLQSIETLIRDACRLRHQMLKENNGVLFISEENDKAMEFLNNKSEELKHLIDRVKEGQ